MRARPGVWRAQVAGYHPPPGGQCNESLTTTSLHTSELALNNLPAPHFPGHESLR